MNSLELYFLYGMKAPIKVGMVELRSQKLQVKRTVPLLKGTAVFTVSEKIDMSQDFFTRINGASYIIRLVDPPTVKKPPQLFLDQDFVRIPTTERVETERPVTPRISFSNGKWAPVYFASIKNMFCKNALEKPGIVSSSRTGTLRRVKTPISFDLSNLIIKISKINYSFNVLHHTKPYIWKGYTIYEELSFYAVPENNYTYCKKGRTRYTAPNHTGQRHMHF